MENPRLFPDEIAEELRSRVRTGSVIRVERVDTVTDFTPGRIAYSLYASDVRYKDARSGVILSAQSLIDLIYDTLEAGGHAYIDGVELT